MVHSFISPRKWLSALGCGMIDTKVFATSELSTYLGLFENESGYTIR